MNIGFLKLCGVALIAGSMIVGAAGQQPTAAQSATPAATHEATVLPPHVVAVFAEYTNKPQSVQSLTIHDDGSLLLDWQTSDGDAYQSVWQQSGKASQDTLASLTALLNSDGYKALGGPYSVSSFQTDCHNITITALVGSQTKEIDGFWVEQPYPGEPDILAKVVTALHNVRQPLETLVTFEWSGGFAARDTLLTIQNNGNVQLEDKFRKTITRWQVSQAELQPLRQLLKGESFAAFKPPTGTGCADCFIYSITGNTSQGVKTIAFDEAQPAEALPKDIRQLVPLLQGFQPPADAIPATAEATQSS